MKKVFKPLIAWLLVACLALESLGSAEPAYASSLSSTQQGYVDDMRIPEEEPDEKSAWELAQELPAEDTYTEE